MIDVTPQTDADTEVTVGDKVRVRWLLNASADPADITLTVTDLMGEATTYSGASLFEEEVEVDSERHWRYYKDIALPSLEVRFEWELDDEVNDVHASSRIVATY